ncbi:YuzB family protein [Alkalihalobacillus hwajinpoensis]|uniref:YuzB family protein n=1 Tax=Guptibacillus hwajinpoensis TaxID=208199 RepID=UPI0018831791|nr:YuzB family protein [Pseudalkalibacillus hwajinpoensis]MBF0708620.1 YuzB family protein [Pseudalkalibacillus hwajinpoensis]
MNPIVEFCMSNLSSGSHKAMEKLEKDTDLDVLEYSCLGHCTLCSQDIYCLVNGERVTAETPDELVDNVYQFIEENQMF